MDVTLNDKEKTLDGFAKITYVNRSPDTLHFIWFHLWPNAYKNDQTAFSDQLLQNGNTAFYFADRSKRGYINRLDFKVDGITAKTEDHLQHIDITKVILPSPLLPGQPVQISTPFHVKLPFNFSRGGYDGNFYSITQWYPKPAVYDGKGWHPMPYLDQGEFYSEFGNYDVRITVPTPYVVAATGALQNEEEKEWLKTRRNYTSETQKSNSSKTVVHQPKPKTSPTKSNTSITSRQKAAASQKQAQQPVNNTAINAPVTSKTLRFLQDDVHDFAWFANKDFIVQEDTFQLSSGKTISVGAYYTEPYKAQWEKSVSFAKDAIRFYSDQVGEYPYNTVTAVQGPKSFGGGMEYPTITVISPTPSSEELDIILAHEIGHNWFYGILGTNERLHPWMDEGLNTFYERKYTTLKYGEQPRLEELVFHTSAKERLDQPISKPSAAFSPTNYGVVAYHKTAKWFEYIEQKIGSPSFQKAIQEYYSTWKFRHPQPEDLIRHFSVPMGNDSTSLLQHLHTKGALPNQQLSGFKLITTLQPKSIENYLKQPSKNALILSPAVGYNVYDGFMLGGLITNYKLPPSSFQFLAVPLYGFRSKTLNGLGKISYALYPSGGLQKVELFANGASFSMNEFKDNRDQQYFFGFRKFVPGASITFKQRNPQSSKKHFLEWKSYFIQEDRLRLRFDSIFGVNDTIINEVVNKNKNDYNVHQLQWGIEDNRALYPYAATFTAQGNQQFRRISFEGNYFFNYREGGLQLRLFAGKLFYPDKYQFEISRFALNMSGPNGEEDYTYSNYFVGRNRFEGLASQQIMIRDGGFKIRTELLAEKAGKTNNWLAAINLSSTIPSRFNPLSLLPVKIPVKVFADIGTYAEAWEQRAEKDRFLFDAGLQMSFFNETIHIYFPLVYSNVFSDYVKSIYPKNRVLKTMTFSINLTSAYKGLRKGIY